MITLTNVFKADKPSGIICESFCSLKQNVLPVPCGDEDRQLLSEGVSEWKPDTSSLLLQVLLLLHLVPLMFC